MARGSGWGIVERIIQQFPDVDRSHIEEIVRFGYIEEEVKDILEACELNASTAGIEPDDPGWIPWVNRALAAIIQRFEAMLNTGQYDALDNADHTSIEIRNIVFTNLMPTAQLLARTADVRASGEYDRLRQLGYADIQIRSLTRAGFTVSQLRALADRMNDAQRNGVDSQRLTIQRIDDLLFKKRSMNSVQTLGIVPALLSGIDSKMREGEVARCIIDYVTMFDVPYGLGGAHGQVDVGTRHTIIEVKVDSVPDGRDTYKQIRGAMTNDVMNPSDVNGRRRAIILYAPRYGKAATASLLSIGAYVVKSCEQLREQIRQLGGP